MVALSLYDHLIACTVKLVAENGVEGTAFFVAPGKVLTCATSFTTRRAGCSQ